jgi:hypothetical protein
MSPGEREIIYCVAAKPFTVTQQKNKKRSGPIMDDKLRKNQALSI